MNTDRPCGCKSFKTCFLCEPKLNLTENYHESLLRSFKSSKTAVYCDFCGNVFPGWDVFNACAHDEAPINEACSGVNVIRDFISLDERNELLEGLDSLPWDPSVSGRRKQNFGPKANFKKRKTKRGAFKGFPTCTQFLQKRFDEIKILSGYRTVEQCSIEYRKSTGAWIEPHVDDCWIWGERIVQLHILSNSVLTLSKVASSSSEKYNLPDVASYPKILSDNGDRVLYNPLDNVISSEKSYTFEKLPEKFDVLRVPLPERSLLILHGQLRYQWEHCVLRDDVLDDRRVIIAYREFTPPYLPGGKEFEGIGREVIESAKLFW